MSSSQDKKRSAGKPGSLPIGENKTGLTPAIPFCEQKPDEDDDEVETVDIRVMIDPLKGSSDKTNIDVKTFPSVKNLTGAGLEVLKLRRSLNIDVFKPEGLVGSLSVEKRLTYFERFLKGSAKLQWNTAFVECQKQVLDDLLTADNVSQIRNVVTIGTRKSFYEYLKSTETLDMTRAPNKRLKGASLQQAKDGLATPGFKCLSFERALWFHMHKTMWTKSRNVFSDQERYLSQHITKPFKWSMVKYCERIRELYDSLQYLPPHSLKGEEYKEADWVSLEKVPLEQTIRLSIRDGLPAVMQDELDQKETDYRLMSPEEFYSALDDIENADIRRRQMKEQVRATEKAMRASKRAAADSSSDDNSHAKKRKKGRDRKSKSKTTAQGTARFCELCKKAGMPYAKYSSHSTSQCKDAAEMKAKLSGGFKDRAEATNSWKKKEHKAILKEVKSLKKQNKQLMKIMAQSKSSKKKKEKKNLHKIVSKTRNIALDSSSSSSSSSDSSSDSDSD
jgi:hypothetical protein